jgi:uncharacterized protein (DUF2249 family)
MADFTLDLRGLASHARTRAYYTLRELAPGQVCEVLLDQDPGMIMEAVGLQLRHGLHWQVESSGPPLWRVSVRRREDVEPADLVDLLMRDHLRMDRVFADALHKANAGDLAGAEAGFRVFMEGLRRHVRVENELIVPLLDLPRDPSGQDPTSVMLHEHDQILEQTALLERQFEEGVDAAWEVAPFFALISGAMAKHEGREESNLFPHWSRALRALPDGGAEMLVKARYVLYGEGA